MSVDVNALRSFLVQSPRAAKILITSGDGEQKEVVPPKGVGGVTWAGVARSIATLDPARVELFDAEDKLIRAQSFDATSIAKGEVLPDILARDAESARIAMFAKHIADAYRFSVETAFQKMVDIFERLDARQERVERRLEHAENAYRKMMQQSVDDALDQADEVAKEAEAAKADPLAGLVSSFVGGMAQGGSQEPPNGKASKP